ncbi:MAG: phage/plasmid primase, P4 family [Methylovulum sp.]|nr:phage/plasmid primase, P4 family [Methylovulum sp.]
MLQINVFQKKNSKFPTATIKFNSVVELLAYFETISVPQIKAKEDIELVHYGQLIDPEKGRTKSNFESTEIIAIDIDGITEKELESALKAIDPYHYVIHTTFSSTDDNLRLRLIVPLSQSITLADFEQRKLASCLADLMGVAEIDNVSNNPVQLYYLPSSPIGVEGVIDVHKGQACLSLDDLPKAAKAVKASKSSRKNSNADKSCDEIMAAAKDVIKTVFDGHILFTNNLFYIYVDGIWGGMSKDELISYLVVETYDTNKPITEVEAIVKALKVLVFVSEFPKAKRKHNVLVLGNCAICPVTGKKLAHSPKHYALNQLNFDYDEVATCLAWLKFQNEIWVDDKDRDDKILLLQELMGLSLTDITKFHTMIWLIGPGSNGKSVILSILRELVGSENAASLSLGSFKERFALVGLLGKLVNIDSEMAANSVLADDKLKKVVSGEYVALERKMEPGFDANITAKLWAAANTLPITKDHSLGFFRRVAILEFNRIFKTEEQDKTLEDKLKAELPGIFNWAIIGLRRLLSNDRLTIPESSSRAIDDYKANSNPVEKFFQEHLSKMETNGSPKAGMSTHEAYEAFKKYCSANGFGLLNSSNFGVRLKSLGITKQGSNGKNYYPVKVHGMDKYKSDAFSQSNSSGPRKVDIDDAFNGDIA